MKPRYRDTGLVIGCILMTLFALHLWKSAWAGYFENPEPDLFARMWWVWAPFVYLPALLIGLFAYRRPMFLSAVAYVICALVLSFDGHGPYRFQDSSASMIILGDAKQVLRPHVSHGVLVLNYLLFDIGKPIAGAVALAWLGSRLRRRLTLGSSDRAATSSLSQGGGR